MVRTGFHVHAGKGVHDSRHRGLPGARLRPHGIFRGRYRRPAVLDRPADRIGGSSAYAATAIARADAADPSGCRPAQHADASVPKPQLMRRLRRTKIVATLGPASSDRSVIASLFEAGADVFRIQISHTTHPRTRELAAAVHHGQTRE